MHSPYREPPPPIAIEPERPWFPKMLELVRILPKKDAVYPFELRHVGKIGWVSIIADASYLISFGRQHCGIFHLSELAPVKQ